MFNVLVTFYCVLFLSLLIAAQDEVKRGDYPYMAFLYYPDDTVLDINGNRFFQSAIILHLDCLISASIDSKTINDSFPRKTLMARAGALTIDSKVVINEDQGEQEREVIRIVRPAMHNEATYWRTDITLLKTLTPFNISQTVGVAPSILKPYTEKTCTILMYMRKSEMDRTLVRRSVELMTADQHCRPEFAEETMLCGGDQSSSKQKIDCMGNQGGPLICEDIVVGLQTYLTNQCEAPHLYQLLSKWSSYILCGAEDKCKNVCRNVCRDTDKDDTKADFPVKVNTNKKIHAEHINVTRSTQTIEVTTVMDTENIPVMSAVEKKFMENTSKEVETNISEKNQTDIYDTQNKKHDDDSSEIIKQAVENKKLDEEHDLIKQSDDESMRRAVEALQKQEDFNKTTNESVKSDIELLKNDEKTTQSEGQVSDNQTQLVEPVNQPAESKNLPDESAESINQPAEMVNPLVDLVNQPAEIVNQPAEPATQTDDSVNLPIDSAKNRVDSVILEPETKENEPSIQDKIKPETETTNLEVENQNIDSRNMTELEPVEQKTEPVQSQLKALKPDALSSKSEAETNAEVVQPHSKQERDDMTARKRFDLRRAGGDSNIMKVPKNEQQDDNTTGLVQLISEYQPPKNNSGTPMPHDNEDYFLAVMKVNVSKPEENDKNLRAKTLNANAATKFITSVIRGLCVAIVNLIILM